MTSVAEKPDRREGRRPPARAGADPAVVSSSDITDPAGTAPSGRRPLALICLPLLAVLVVAIAAGVTGIPTFFYDSGEAEPMTIGGVGIGQLIGEYAGADNIFSEGDKPYPKTTWEVLGERQP